MDGADGVTEFLDLTDSTIYFEAKGIDYRVGNLVEIVEAPATRKLDQEKPQEIAKLMAMRGLGALGDKAALPALQKVLESKHRFYPEQARAAIAQIEGNQYVRPAADAAAMESDLALLPAGLGVVLQCRLAPGKPADVKLAAGEFAKISDMNLKAAEVLKRFNQQAIGIAEKIGNVRLDGLTFGMSGSETEGEELLMVAIVRGLYDPKALEAMVSELDDVKALNLGGVFLSDTIKGIGRLLHCPMSG